MPRLISITTSTRDQSAAALTLGEYLVKLGCKYAFIGGFAWYLLGSTRPTQDIDVLVETQNMDIMALREQLIEINKHFASSGVKFYYVKDLIDDLRDEELLHASKQNVLIETLPAGGLGLPTVPEPQYLVEQDSGDYIPILHPSVLILTKMKRWAASCESTYPKTVVKTMSDSADLEYMVYWLAENELHVEFELYKGKTKPELFKYVQAYRRKFCEDKDLMEHLEKIIKPEDWAALIRE